MGGIILNKPVYELIGGNTKPIVTKCYSGMIYFDEMDPEDRPSGLGIKLRNQVALNGVTKKTHHFSTYHKQPSANEGSLIIEILFCE